MNCYVNGEVEGRAEARVKFMTWKPLLLKIQILLY